MTSSSLKNRPLGWGILGAGGISNDFCVALLTLPKEEHRIVHIAARDAGRAEDYASRFSIKKFSGEYKKVVEDPDVDVVYVATINVMHKDLSILALNHGKAVLCEKPAAVNCSELDEIFACARSKKLFYMEGLWTRVNPAYIDLLTKVKEKDYGEPNVVYASLGFKELISVKSFQDPDTGTSVLTDVGIYPLTIADMIFDGCKVKEIKASAHLQKDVSLDATVVINIMFEQNKVAVLTCSGEHDLMNDCELLFTKGRVHVPNLFVCPESYSEQTELGTKEFQFPLPKTNMKMNYINSTGLSYEAAHVRECLVNGLRESPLVNHSTTKRILGYLDEIRSQIGVKFSFE